MLIISLLSSVPSLIIVVITPLWGMISYKIDSKKFFIIIGIMANFLLLVIFYFLFSPIQFIIILVIFSLFRCALEPNILAFVTQEMDMKGKAGGLLVTSRSIGLAIGTLSGGFLFQSFGIKNIFLLGALFSGFSLILVVGTKDKKTQILTESKIFNLTPYRKILKNKGILPIYVNAFFYSFGITIFGSLFSVYFIQTGGTSSLLGITYAVMFLIAMTVSTPAGIFADKKGRKPLIVFADFVCGLTTILIFFSKNPYMTAIIWAIPLHPYLIVGSTALIADKTSTKDNTIGMGLFVISQSIGRMIGPIIGGFLSDMFSIKQVIPISASFIFIGGLYSLIFIKEDKKIIHNASS
jgi:predicted MFS family arabinose efflux permease